MNMNSNNPIVQKLQNNMVNQMANQINNNPQLAQAIKYVNDNGGNPKDAFYKLAKEKGVDPQNILNQLMK